MTDYNNIININYSIVTVNIFCSELGFSEWKNKQNQEEIKEIFGKFLNFANSDSDNLSFDYPKVRF